MSALLALAFLVQIAAPVNLSVTVDQGAYSVEQLQTMTFDQLHEVVFSCQQIQVTGVCQLPDGAHAYVSSDYVAVWQWDIGSDAPAYYLMEHR